MIEKMKMVYVVSSVSKKDEMLDGLQVVFLHLLLIFCKFDSHQLLLLV